MKKKLVIIFLVLLALSWYMAVSDTIQKPGKVRACLAKAEELENQEIYVDAITQYEQALVYEPDNTHISSPDRRRSSLLSAKRWRREIRRMRRC